MKFKPYEEYKKADLPWIDEIPSHWEESRVKAITKLKSTRQKDIDSELELLSVYRDYGVVKRTEKDDNHNIIPEDLSNYKVVYKGDLVLNKMKVWQGSLGVSSYDGIVSPAYIVCSVRSNIFGKYLNYLLRNKMYLTIYNKLSYGVRVDQWDMRYEDFKNIELFLPPKEEQDKIADFLDHNLAKIDKFVELTERQIELLKEQKEVLINDVVTKGIDKDVVYKDSGIDWIGEIPEHWRKDKTIRIFKWIGSGTTPNSSNLNYYNNGQYNWINSGDLKSKYLYESRNKITDGAVNENPSLKLFPKDTIIIAMYGATIGNLSILKKESYMNQACCGLAQYEDNYIVNYSYFTLQSMKQFLLESARGGGQPNISQDIIKQSWLPIPPKKEQEEIVAYIEKETDKIDRTIDLYKKQIELIKEYRTSLIASAVTGKIDVRDF